MSITDTPPNRFDFEAALEKARRALSLKAEVPKLESDVRDVALALSHAASRGNDRRCETRAHQASAATARRPLGPLVTAIIKRGHKPTSTRQADIKLDESGR